MEAVRRFDDCEISVRGLIVGARGEIPAGMMTHLPALSLLQIVEDPVWANMWFPLDMGPLPTGYTLRRIFLASAALCRSGWLGRIQH